MYARVKYAVVVVVGIAAVAAAAATKTISCVVIQHLSDTIPWTKQRKRPNVKRACIGMSHTHSTQKSAVIFTHLDSPALSLARWMAAVVS